MDVGCCQSIHNLYVWIVAVVRWQQDKNGKEARKYIYLVIDDPVHPTGNIEIY